MKNLFQWISIFLILLPVTVARVARAEDDPSDRPRASGPVWFDETLSPEETFSRSQAVLEHFDVPAEPDSQPQLVFYQGIQTLDGINALLPYFDPSSEFAKFADIQSTRMNAFQDAQAWQVPDFSAELRSVDGIVAEEPFVSHLKAARANPSDRPLEGLRIALDPGHMGGDWDTITGKWVEDTNGKKLSEGVINLQTAMLLEQQLISLGAQTLITHRGLRPVTDADYQSFDVHAFGLQVLRESSLEDWFLKLVSVAPAGPELYEAFTNSADLKQVFEENNRPTYFNDSDLEARVDVIEAFQPDITLIIHYDAAVHTVSPPAFSHDATKVYVPGSFAPMELASRDDRVQMAMHLLDEVPWRASVAFAHEVVNTLSTNLKIPFDDASPGNVKQVEPGVFSRNLHLLRKHRASATAYVECLFYNDRGEFDALSGAAHPMMIDGVNHPYSDRLALVANSLKQAIVQFVTKY